MYLATSWALAAILIAADNDGTRSVPTTAGEAVLVQFSRQQCPHCVSMQPVVAELLRQGVQVQVIDVDQQPNAAKQLAIPGVPTFVALSGGKEMGRIVGATSYEKLVQLVQSSGFREQGSGFREQGSGFGVRGSEGGQAAAFGGQSLTDSRPPTSDPRPPAPDSRPPSPDAARAATVRIKVEDAGGYGFGTGTIIDIHDNEALVVTCGHLFRESQGRGKITADLFSAGASQTVEGQLIAFDLDRDIALISLRAGPVARPALVAPPGYVVRPGDRVFTIGCDKGAEPSVRTTHITAVNKYKGKPNFTAAGQPVDGRSGGGLFTAEGYLIGICNAADPADDEGLYAGLASIHWQLDQIGQAEIYQRSARLASASAPRDVALAAATARTPAPPLAAAPQLPPQMPPSALAATTATAPGPPRRPPPAGSLATDMAPIAAANDDTEIVFIVRSKRDPAQRSEVFVVDQAPPDLVARITHAARASGEQRAALARAAAASTRTAAANPLPTEPQLVRGQSTDY